MMQTYTSPIGTVHEVPKTWNRKRTGGGQWGNESGTVATQKHDEHILDVVVPLLGLQYWQHEGWLEAVCGCITASRTHNVATDIGATSGLPIAPSKYEADRVLTDGDSNAPYAPGLIVPVCALHNGSTARRQVKARLRERAEYVARNINIGVTE